MMDWLNKEWDFPAHSDCKRESAIMGSVDECVAQLREHLAVGVQKIIFVPYKYQPRPGRDHRARDHPPPAGRLIDAWPQQGKTSPMSDPRSRGSSHIIDAGSEAAIGFLQKMIAIPERHRRRGGDPEVPGELT